MALPEGWKAREVVQMGAEKGVELEWLVSWKHRMTILGCYSLVLRSVVVDSVQKGLTYFQNAHAMGLERVPV